MSATLASLALLVFLSALFSGSETGFYSLSRLRLDAEAREGRWTARITKGLLRDDAGLLITILIGNNLMIELITNLTRTQLEDHWSVPSGAREIVLTLVVTPVLFLFGELLPKDLFHRRANSLVGWAAPVMLAARILFAPLALPVRWVAGFLERMFRTEDNTVALALGRESIVEFLAEGAKSGALTPQAEILARNALELRTRRVREVCVAWSNVRTLAEGSGGEAFVEEVAGSSFTRLPVSAQDGSILGYAHQLDILAAPDRALSEHVRPLLELAPDISVGKALNRLRIGGHRLALVGTAVEPVGLISLKDLVETIAGDLGGW